VIVFAHSFHLTGLEAQEQSMKTIYVDNLILNRRSKMWFTNKELKDEVKQLKSDIKELEKEESKARKQARSAQDDLDILKDKKRREDEEIKHKLKMKEEKADIELEKEKVKMSREKDEAIMEIKDKYRDKVEAHLEKRGGEMKEIMTEILGRLPDISARVQIK
jgi:chromosome segregation ATPase